MAAPRVPSVPLILIDKALRILNAREWIRYFDENRRFTQRINGWVEKTAAYSVNPFDRILANTDGGAFTVTLPADPDTGDEVMFHDSTGNWNTANLTVGGNGNNIDGAATYVASTNNQTFGVVFNGTEWRRTFR